MIIGYQFDSDAYGVNTDIPDRPYEYFMQAMNNLCISAIKAGYEDWKKETASEYFDTSDWHDEEWDDWDEFIINNI